MANKRQKHHGQEKQLGLADASMLKKIDSLFQCNVGHNISLPQIVVVGNQSSGKSSVLEGLTNLPFPKDSGLCTRFATQITFKRSMHASISVSVIPAKDAGIEHIAMCRGWRKTLDALNKDAFTKIMHEVNGVMGIDSTRSPPKTFSKDFLSVEVSGPDEEHLSVIDVPGIFKKTTEGVTTKADMAMVNGMVESYVSNPRSIILAVVPANVDIATQEILDIAEHHDPEGQRTLGVLTKPDLVDEGAERDILDLLKGQKHKLALGWCVLRNLGQKESGEDRERHTTESAFFTTRVPWNQVEKTRAGVEALRVRLGRILVQHTRREFPKVKAELDKLLKHSKARLEGLGPQRASSAEQSSFLVRIASEFQVKTNMALEAMFYSDDSFDKSSELRLANNIVLRNELFAQDFHKYGHDFCLELNPSLKDISEKEGEEEEELCLPYEVKDRFTRTVSCPTEDLDGILAKKVPLLHPVKDGATQWLTDLYTKSRGFELGTFDPKLLAAVMKQ